MLVVGDTKAAPGKGTVSVDAAYGTYPTRKGGHPRHPGQVQGPHPHRSRGHHLRLEHRRGGLVQRRDDRLQRLALHQDAGLRRQRPVDHHDAGQHGRQLGLRQAGQALHWNYLDTATRAKFYCSHLVWASFKDNFGIDLNTSAYLGAVHPMELVDTDKTYLIWRKA